MKYFLFTVSAIAMFFTLSSCGQAKTPVNCSKYKTGTFFYHFTMNEAEFHFTLKRNDSLQSETNEKSGKAVRFKVNWIDSCTYELRYLDGLEELPKETLDLKKKIVLQTSILGGTEKYYLFKTTSNSNSQVLSDTIWIKK